MNNKTLQDICRQIQTPAYVFSYEDFKKRADLVHTYFGEKTSLCFSIKANPFLVSMMPNIITRLEVCSPGELTVCEKNNVDMDRVIYSGVNKGYDDVKRAVENKVGVLTCESISHIEIINEVAKSSNTSVNVYLRLTAGSQFGMDKSVFCDIIKNREKYTNINIIGIHYFSGTQKKKASKIQKELEEIDTFLTDIKERFDFSIDIVEYGTGLAVDYFTDTADKSEENRISEISEMIKDFSEKYELTVEMGRFFAAPCGYYFTRIADTKTNCSINYAICDGGLHQIKYYGQIQGMQTPKISYLGNTQKATTNRWTLCGSLCTTADILANAVELPHLKSGDVLCFHRTGAYCVYEGMSMFLSRDLPRIYLHKNNESALIRERIDTDIFNVGNSF